MRSVVVLGLALFSVSAVACAAGNDGDAVASASELDASSIDARGSSDVVALSQATDVTASAESSRVEAPQEASPVETGSDKREASDARCQGELIRESFEGPDDRGWTHESVELGLTDPWIRGSTTAPTCHAGTTCWSTGLQGDYRNCGEAVLVSPVIDLAACATAPAVRVSWWQWVSLETFAEGTYFDSALVQISRDGGATWDYLPSPGPTPAYLGTCGIHDDGCGSALPFVRGQRVWSDHDLASWQVARFEVPKGYATTSFRVRFLFGSDFKAASRGWLIDDFSVSRL